MQSELSTDTKLAYLIDNYIKTVVFNNNKTEYPLPLSKVIAGFIGHCLFAAWDKKLVGVNHELNGRCISISDIQSICWSSSFGSIIASHGSYQWRFKVIDLVADNGWHVGIGIWRVISNKEPPTDTYFTCKFVDDNS